MKLLNKVIFFLSLLYFSGVNAQDVSINILDQPASLNVGSTNGQVTVDICNNDGGTKSAPLSKVRPLITLPSSLIGTSLVAISNVGWQVLSNNGSTVMFENTSTIASGECSQIILGYTAINPGGPLTITGTIGFNGSQTAGNLSGNDNSTTSITVLLDTDKDTIADVNDIDDDNDGILDTVEYQACGIGGTAACDTDGDGIPNHLDLDSDNDGINDVNEAGSTLIDIEGNGQADGVIQSNGAISSPISIYSLLPNPDADSLANPYDLDSDNDGLSDLKENGLLSSLDVNNDGLVDCSTNCDSDNDGILTPVDSIQNTWGDALDTDHDNIPDITDLDDDNDGILDTVEDATSCSGVLGLLTVNSDCDSDGIPNRLDLDSDNDGMNDVVEAGGTDADGNGNADGIISISGIPASAGSGLSPPNTDAQGGANPYDLDSDNDGLLDLIEGGLANSLDANDDGLVDCSINCDSDNDGILTPVDAIPNIWGDTLLPDLSPTTEIASLEFLTAGTQKDFVVNVFEINSISNIIGQPIAFRVAKTSAFDITYAVTSGMSNVFSTVNNSNSDWIFTETANFITVTAKSIIAIPIGGSKVIGFRATRKTGIPQNTSQNITVTIIYGSAGEEKVDNNIVETKITAN